MYFFYKSNIIFKSLIGILLYGVIIFVFFFYIGVILDKEIIRCLGIFDLVEVGDFVMVDKGFDIEDLFRGKSVSFNFFFFLESRS